MLHMIAETGRGKSTTACNLLSKIDQITVGKPVSRIYIYYQFIQDKYLNLQKLLGEDRVILI